MSLQVWIWIIVGVTFALYIGIAIWSKAGSTNEFYIFTTPEFNVNVCLLPFWALSVLYCWKGCSPCSQWNGNSC